MKHDMLIDTLRRELGAHAIVDSPDALMTYDSDGSVMAKRAPDLVVLPTAPEQIVAAVKQAYQHDMPIVPRGAGTGLSGGATPMRGGMIIGTSRMDQVLAVDVANSRALIQPGVINFELSQFVKSYGYKYAPDPSSQKACTIGGNIATNSGGPHCLKYGVTLNHILALDVVLHDGTRFWTSDGIADQAGYDLTGLVVGSEGTLCLVAQAAVRLTRLPEAKRVVLALFPDVVSASEVVSTVIGSGYLPTSLEMMDRNAIRAVNEGYNLGLPPESEALLLIEVDGVEDGLDDLLQAILEICTQHGALEMRPARTEEEQNRAWAARKNAFGAIGRLAPAYYLVDTVVPRTRLPFMMEQVTKLGEAYNMPMANIFHAGDGNLHPLVLYNPRDPEEVHKAHEIAEAVMRLSIEEGGVISGEHGIGVEKQNYMAMLFNAADLQAMAVVYATFNPRAQFNPAKMFPTETNPLKLAEQHYARLTRTSDRLGTDELESRLAAIVGQRYLLAGDAASSYVVQGNLPRYAVQPADLEQLSRVLSVCHRAGASVVPWGGGTHQQIGNLMDTPDVVVSLQRLNRVLKYEPKDLTISVEAGMPLAELQRVLAANGQMVPFDAALPEQTTIGGLVALGLMGARRGYGTLRDLLLGMTIVEVDGTIIRNGGQVVKNVSGYDLVRLFHGSMGTLGVIASVNLKLLPQPHSEATLLATFGSTADALATLGKLAATQLVPTATEYLDRGALERIGVVGAAALAVRAEGVAAATERHMRDVAALAQQHGALETRTLHTTDQQQLWQAISDLSSTHDVGGDVAVLRLSVLPADLPAALEQISTLATRHGIAVATAAHVLHGVILMRLTANADTLRHFHTALVARWKHCHLLACAPQRKVGIAVWGTAPDGLSLMQALKHAYDPANRLNPGRYVVS